MLKCNEKDGQKTLVLDSGDYGIGVEITINNFEFTDDDVLVFTINRRNTDREVVLRKENKISENNSFLLLITEEETKRLEETVYSYELEIYRNGSFLLTVTKNQDFVVEGGY